jgi:ribose 1,5-bisphosphokinase PhnN
VSRRRTVIFVAVTTGSGKSALVNTLTQLAAVYIEDATLNPHFTARSRGTFDAGASQRWFLDRIAEFLERHPTGVLAIDQHPRVVSRVYGAMFSAKGLLSGGALTRLDWYADRLLKQVSESAANVLTVCLSASTETLRARLLRRKRPGLTVSEVLAVNRLYSSVVFPGPCLTMNTDVMSIQREKAVLEAWLSEPGAIRLDKRMAAL